MTSSATRFALTVAAASALLVGVGLGATALSRSSDAPDPDPTVGAAVTLGSPGDSTPSPRATSDDPTEIRRSPEVDDLDDDHGGDRPDGDADDRVALPPSDARLGSVPGAVGDDDHGDDDHGDDGIRHDDDPDHEDD